MIFFVLLILAILGISFIVYAPAWVSIAAVMIIIWSLIEGGD